jgi:hypothetical protein
MACCEFSERTNLISADIVGPRMDAARLYELHDVAVHVGDQNIRLLTEGNIFDGIEAFPIRPLSRFNQFIKDAGNWGLPVVSIHGRTGGEGYNPKDTATLIACNALMPATPRVIELYAHSHDVLFHVPELEDGGNIASLTKHKDRTRFVWVENHHGKESMAGAMRKVAQLRSLGIPSAVMFDVCHYIGARNLVNGSFQREYAQMLHDADCLLHETDAQGHPIVQGIHLPVGRKPDDSLPIDEMDDDSLRALADTINGADITRLVLEHQERGFLYMLHFSPKRMDTVKKRHEVIINRLLRTNVLK